MARPRRLQFSGGHYHVISRGNAKGFIFIDDDDRQAFMQSLGMIARRLRWEILAYCLLSNHYHLFVATPEPSLARGMQVLNARHAQRFNRRHERVGHVFEGRYTAKLVDTDAYLLTLIRYIALNPVEAGLCSSPEEWPWSSHAAALGLVPTMVPFAWDRILLEFGHDPEVGFAEYVKFIAGPDAATEPLGDFPNPTIIGDSAFTETMSERAKCLSREVIRKERISRSLSVYEAQASSRNTAIQAAYASGAFSLAQLARHFGLHYSTVSKICRTTEKDSDLGPDLFRTFD